MGGLRIFGPLLLLFSFTAVGQTNWSWVTPLDGGEFLRSIMYFRSNFFAVGSGEAIRSSADGSHWRSMPSLGKKGLSSIAASDSVLVALGSSEAWRSEDGVTWNAATAPHFGGPFGMVYGGGRFVGVGQGGAVVSSPDGINWEIAIAPGGPFFYSVAFGAGTFVAVGIDVVQTSTDGKSWKPIALNFGMDMYAVTYGSAGFVAVGQPGIVAQSADGQAWQTNSFPSSREQWMNAITFDREYIATGEDLSNLETGLQGSPIFHSADAIHWIIEPSHAQTRLLGVAAGGNRAIAVGAGGEVVSATGLDYTDWQSQTRRLLPVASLVCTVGEGLVISGMNDFFIVSSNSNHLQIVKPQIAGWQTNDHWAALAFGHGQFVSVSNYGKVATSTNGYEWAEGAPFVQSGGLQLLYVRDRFFARNFSGLYTSLNGVSWDTFPVFWSGSTEGSLVAYGNGQFVAPPFVSTDGSNWTPWRRAGSVQAIAFGNGRFLTLSSFNELSYSTNAQSINWTRLTPPGSGLWPVAYSAGLKFINERFFAFSSTGKLISSIDGTLWDEVASFGMAVQSLASDGKIWAASDDTGGLVVSRPEFTPKTRIVIERGLALVEASTQTGLWYQLFQSGAIEGSWNVLGIEQPGAGDPVYWRVKPAGENQFFKVLQD